MQILQFLLLSSNSIAALAFHRPEHNAGNYICVNFFMKKAFPHVTIRSPALGKSLGTIRGPRYVVNNRLFQKSSKYDVLNQMVYEKSRIKALNESIQIGDKNSTFTSKKRSSNNLDHHSLSGRNINKPTKRLVSSLNRDSVITVADLEEILRNNNFLQSTVMNDASLLAWQKSNSRGSNKDQVAFPQISTATSQNIIVASTAVTGILGMTIGAVTFPNLWLIGMVLGAFYGNKVATEGQGNPSNIPLSSFILYVGMAAANIYLRVRDTMAGIWFMYKTGQLSYEYYKTYEKFDKRFQIQKKVDAWNMRFKEGKEDFDRWERKNEVGRKILAGLRTAWLVEENSMKKMSRKISSGSKTGMGRRKANRIVYQIKKFMSFIKLFCVTLWNAIFSVGPEGRKDLQDLINNMGSSLRNMNFEEFSQRLGSGFSALVAINVIGALFISTPFLVGSLVAICGTIYPNWLVSTYAQLRDFLETDMKQAKKESTSNATNKKSQAPVKGKYYFYEGSDGKKRWYRTGKSTFRR